MSEFNTLACHVEQLMQHNTSLKHSNRQLMDQVQGLQLELNQSNNQIKAIEQELQQLLDLFQTALNNTTMGQQHD
jgi:predicted  nucleic acid-binding Zn-ribbon protein